MNRPLSRLRWTVLQTLGLIVASLGAGLVLRILLPGSALTLSVLVTLVLIVIYVRRGRISSRGSRKG
jgi:4-hydroxybenzoate polyprenyltransferase